MMTMSKALSAPQARTYHAREFASEQANYWSRGQQGHSEWQGKLAAEFGLKGEVGAEHFARLTEGEHPMTQEQLVWHQPSRTYENRYGKEVTSVGHRAGWDATISAPKSVSLTALVGGDERVREAHRESVRVALAEFERYTQVRMGNVREPEKTGKFVAATFEHDTARPVDGYAAPQLHTHVVVFNVAESKDGDTHALQERGLFQSQAFATAVYRTELAARLQGLGYEIERGEHGQPEIKGYSREYLEASSPRRAQITTELKEIGREGAGAAQVAAHRTRDSKEIQSPEEVLHRHRTLAAEYGHEADWVVSRSFGQQRGQEIDAPKAAQQAVTYAREHVFERAAIQDERAILQAAMDRMEREIVSRMDRGNWHLETSSSIAEKLSRTKVLSRRPQLNSSQQGAAEQILTSHEKIVGLDGVAGAGKTTTLAVIREGAEANGYRVEGFAPTSRAAQKLGEAGIQTSTLQLHLAKGQQTDTGERRLYILDESSLASTKQMHDFVTRLHPNDRVLLVGDTRQHEAVEAGRPFAQLQEAGMRTAKLDEIVRQRDAALKQVVEQLAKGQVGEAVQGLERQGRVHEVANQADRIAAIAKEYARQPENTLVVSPDNRSRAEINQAIRTELKGTGVVGKEEHRTDVLVPRQDLTGADRTWAERYHFDDVLLYSRNSKETGLKKGEYARVKSVDAAANQLTIVRADGSELNYDPRRQQGVSLYRDQQKAFAVGDRIQFTAPANDLKIANRDLGTIQGFTDDGHMSLKMDSGRSVSLDPRENPHLDHGYAVTSHSSQGQTADRVLIHIDTELGAKDLLNNRMAYVAVSRGAQDAQIFTSDRQQLPQVLSRQVSHQSAHVPEVQQEPERQQVQLTGRELMDQHLRRWTPLNKALPEHEAKQFHWQQESGTMQSYKHVQTGRYLHIDGQAGTFHNQHREAITAKQALDYAMPEGHKHSHSLDLKPEREISIRGYGFGVGM